MKPDPGDEMAQADLWTLYVGLLEARNRYMEIKLDELETRVAGLETKVAELERSRDSSFVVR